MTKNSIVSLLLVYSRRRAVSTGLPLRRLERLNGNRRGFLLLELAVALLAVGIFSAIVASFMGHMMTLRHDAQRCLEATTYAQTCLEHIQSGAKSVPQNALFTVRIERTMPETEIPYEIVTLSIVWRTARGTEQSISYSGGVIQHAS